MSVVLMQINSVNRRAFLAGATRAVVGTGGILVALRGSPGQSAERVAAVSRQPIRLHPDNPHYFLFRGKSTVLIGANEHYGAVLNLDFDYVKYLNTLQAQGLNYTRIFSGNYIEPYVNMGSHWNIEENTLGPASTRFICPWARSRTPGFEGGGNKFDLSQFDPEYFTRLKDFVSKAGERGVVVELVFFCLF